MKYPDVLGYTLKEAEQILTNGGFKFKILYYTPPKNQELTNNSNKRIVNTIIENNNIILIVCDF